MSRWLWIHPPVKLVVNEKPVDQEVTNWSCLETLIDGVFQQPTAPMRAMISLLRRIEIARKEDALWLEITDEEYAHLLLAAEQGWGLNQIGRKSFHPFLEGIFGAVSKRPEEI